MLLTEYLKDQLDQLSYDKETGIAYGSVRLAARMAGVDEQAIRTGLRGAETSSTKLAEYLTSRGFEGAETDPIRGLPADLIAAICNYYSARAGRWCNETATNSVEMFTQIGLTVAIKQAIGVAVDDRPAPALAAKKASSMRGTLYDSAWDLLSDEQKWKDQMRRNLRKTRETYASDPVLLGQLEREHQAELSRGYANRHTGESSAVPLKEPKITITSNIRSNPTVRTFDRAELDGILAPYHFLSVRYAAFLLSPETYPQEPASRNSGARIRWTAPLLSRLGWVSIGSNWFCLDPLDPKADPFRTILWMREADALPSPPDANPWSAQIDQAIRTNGFRVKHRSLVYLDSMAVLDWLNKDAVVAVLTHKTVAMQLRRRGWTSHQITTSGGGKQAGMWLPRYVGKARPGREVI